MAFCLLGRPRQRRVIQSRTFLRLEAVKKSVIAKQWRFVCTDARGSEGLSNPEHNTANFKSYSFSFRLRPKRFPFYVDLTKERAQRKSSLFLCQVMRKIRRSRQRVAAGRDSRIHRHVVTTRYLFFYTTTPHFVHPFLERREIISCLVLEERTPSSPRLRSTTFVLHPKSWT